MTKIIQRSFTSGELAPALRARADLGKFATGLHTCRNFFIKSQGGIYSRSGQRFICELSDSSKRGRLIPFSFNTEQTYALIFENNLVRVIKGDWLVTDAVTTITNITQANPAVVTDTAHGYTTGDKLMLASILGMTELNNVEVAITVLGVNSYSLDGVDSTGFTAYASDGSAGKIFELVTPYTTAQLPRLAFTQSADVLTIVHPDHDPSNLNRLADNNWTLVTIPYTPTTATPVNVVAIATGSGGGTYDKTYQYVVTAIGADDSESLGSTFITITLSSLSATYGVKVTWTAVAGAKYYKIYKADTVNTKVFGWIGESKDSGTPQFSDFNIAPDMTIAPPEDRDPFALVGDKPSAVNYYQQRQIYANTINQPQTMWSTQTANYSSLRTSSPARANDAVTLSVIARQVNEIRHIIALDALILMTSGGEWKVTEGQEEVLEPATVGIRIQSYTGASWVPPVVINDTVVFVQEKGARVRDLGYTFSADKYQGNDLSIMSEHLFEGYEIEEMTYAAEPYGILWCVRSDGTLLGMTYQREHEVWGWHRHDTDGKYESVISIAEGQRDAPYFIVNRTIGGVTKRFVERSEPREEKQAVDCFYVDSGLSYGGAATLTVSGLNHLEGEAVSILADGNVVKGQIVTGGRIAVPTASKKIHIGLPYTPEAITLSIDAADQIIRGSKKSASEIDLLVDKSRGGWVGPFTGDEADMLEIKPRLTSDGYDTIALRTGTESINITPDWSDDAQVRIIQIDPLPLSILAIIPEIDLGS